MTGDRVPTEGEAAARIQQAETVFDAAAVMSIAICDRGEPWIGRVFFVEDEPSAGRLDLCCAIVETPHTREMLGRGVSVAFIVAGGSPDRWINGAGTAELVEDEADVMAIAKRLRDKSGDVSPFLDTVATRAIRVHVHRLKLTDLAADPPVAEFTFE